MKIRNRLQDIRDAQTQVLQDFFELEVVPHFPNNQWISELYSIVQNDQSSSSYAGTWSKFRRCGIQGFAVKDMDTTIIIAVLGWRNNLTNKLNFGQFKHIQKRFSTITDDRNFNAHMNSNETPSELFLWACGTINNIRMFLKAVCDHSTAPMQSIQAYYQKHNAVLNKLVKDLEADYTEERKEQDIEIRIQREIAEIQKSSDPQKTYFTIIEQYYREQDLELDRRFMLCATEAGISYTSPFVGDLYFDGLTVEKDYVKAAACYEQGFQHLNPHQIVRLGSIYVNQISTKRSREEGQNMINTCKPIRGTELCTYTTDEGYVFYGFRKQQPKAGK